MTQKIQLRYLGSNWEVIRAALVAHGFRVHDSHSTGSWSRTASTPMSHTLWKMGSDVFSLAEVRDMHVIGYDRTEDKYTNCGGWLTLTDCPQQLIDALQCNAETA